MLEVNFCYQKSKGGEKLCKHFSEMNDSYNPGPAPCGHLPCFLDLGQPHPQTTWGTPVIIS